MAAASAVLEILLQPQGEVYPRLNRLGQELWRGLSELRYRGSPVVVQGAPTCFHMLFAEKPLRNYRDFAAYDSKVTERWVEAALRQGIFQMADGRWYVSLAHSEQDIALTLEKARTAIQEISAGVEA